jgi:hypothetical protein
VIARDRAGGLTTSTQLRGRCDRSTGMRTLSIFAFTSITVACSGSAPANDTTSSNARQTLTASCEGPIRCKAGSTETSATLHRNPAGTGCVVQAATLLAGGAVEDNPEATWTDDADTVRVCQATSCFTCARSDGSPPASGTAKPKTKSCHGSASCPGSPPCADVRGCNLHTNYHYDGRGNVSYTDYSCDGPAAPCDAMSSAESCKRQGCSWE